MAYYLTLATKLRTGVTKEQVEQALEPVLENSPENVHIEIDQATNTLWFGASGNACNDLKKDVAAAASKMGPLVAGPRHMTLYNGDAKFGEEPNYFYIGDSPEAIQKAQIERLSEVVVGLTQEILDVPGGAKALPTLIARMQMQAEMQLRAADKKRAAAKPAPGPAL